MKNATDDPRRKPGRPLSFDREAALHEAMLLFWRYGYEATSLSQLTAAMGITPPSLYTAFGDKKQLFLEAIERYTSGPITVFDVIEGSATARDAAREMMRGAAVALTGTGTPPGCMLVSSATNCSSSAGDVQAAVAKIRLRIESALRRKIERDIATGVLPEGTNPVTLASFCMAIIQGMSTQARDGARRAKLTAMAEIAIGAWPVENRQASTP